MRAHRGIGEDAFGGAGTGALIEAGRVEADQQNTVEPGAIAHGPWRGQRDTRSGGLSPTARLARSSGVFTPESASARTRRSPAWGEHGWGRRRMHCLFDWRPSRSPPRRRSLARLVSPRRTWHRSPRLVSAVTVHSCLLCVVEMVFSRPPQQAGQHREKMPKRFRGDRPCLCQRAFPAEAAIGETRSERRLCGAATRLDDVARDSTETDVKQRGQRALARGTPSPIFSARAQPWRTAPCRMPADAKPECRAAHRHRMRLPHRPCLAATPGTSGPIRAELHGCVPQSGAGADAETLSQRPYSRCAQWRASSPLPRTGHARVDSLAEP